MRHMLTYWHTWSVNKVMRLIQYHSVFIFKLQILFVPFKIVPLGGYTPPETLFPLFIATLVVANRNRFKLVTAFMMFSTVPKWCPLRWNFSFGNKKKSHGLRSGEYGSCGTTGMPFLAKNSITEIAVWQGVLSWATNCQQCLVTCEQLFFLVFQEFPGNKTD